MAAVVKLTRYGASDLDLINGTDGIYLEFDKWVRKVAQNDERVIEVLTIRIVGTSEDNIAAIIALIEEMRRDARRYMNSPLEDREVHLEVKLTGETNSYQALVTDLELSPMDDFYTYPTSVQFTTRYKLAIERMPFWERTASRNDSFAQVNTVGGTDTYYGSSDPQGDVSSRIKTFSVGPYSAASPGAAIAEIWAGFKSEIYGTTLANFVPVWEAEDGTVGTDASIDTTTETTTASPGGGSGAFVVVAPGTETMETRLTIKVSDVTANEFDQRGKYTVLARVKLTAGSTTWRVRLLDAFSSASSWRTQSRREVTLTNWFFVDLGTVTLPPERAVYISNIGEYSLRLQAERVSGSGNLRIDCLVLIPHDEGAVHLSGCEVENISGSDDRSAQVYTEEAGAISGLSYDEQLGSIDTDVDVSPTKWALPLGPDTILVLAAHRSASSVLTDDLAVSISFNERWRMLRGTT